MCGQGQADTGSLGVQSACVRNYYARKDVIREGYNYGYEGRWMCILLYPGIRLRLWTLKMTRLTLCSG